MPRPRRSHDTREKLLDEGLRALIAHGYHGTGIKEIVDRVKVPKGSFYNYFASKEQFGAEVIGHYSDWLLGLMDAAFQDAEDDPLKALRQYYAQSTDLYEREGTGDGCLLCNLGAELGDTSGVCREAMAEAFKRLKERLVRVLALGQQAGEVRGDVPAADLALVLMDAWDGALIRMKIEQSVEPLRAFQRLYLDRLITA